MNRVNFRNDYGHDDRTTNIVVDVIIWSRVYATARRLSVCLSLPSGYDKQLLWVCCCAPDSSIGATARRTAVDAGSATLSADAGS